MGNLTHETCLLTKLIRRMYRIVSNDNNALNYIKIYTIDIKKYDVTRGFYYRSILKSRILKYLFKIFVRIYSEYSNVCFRSKITQTRPCLKLKFFYF